MWIYVIEKKIELFLLPNELLPILPNELHTLPNELPIGYSLLARFAYWNMIFIGYWSEVYDRKKLGLSKEETAVEHEKKFWKGFPQSRIKWPNRCQFERKKMSWCHMKMNRPKKNLTYWQKNVIGLASIFTETVHWSRLDWHLCHNSRQLIDILCTLA